MNFGKATCAISSIGFSYSFCCAAATTEQFNFTGPIRCNIKNNVTKCGRNARIKFKKALLSTNSFYDFLYMYLSNFQ